MAALAATTFVVALAAVLTNTPVANAHARVESTAPQDGAVVSRQPATVSFTFDESVESSFGAVRVFDAQSRRVDTGETFHPADAGSVVAVRLRPGLPQGTYTATFRVVSADGHPVAGGFVFSVGKAGVGSRQSVSQLAGKAGGGPVTSTAFAVTRALQYGAIATAIGLLAFLVLVLPRGPSRGAAERRAVDDRVRRILVVAGAVGAVSGILAVLLEGAIGGGTSLWASLHWSVIRETLGTRFGVVWGSGAIGWIAVAIVGPRVVRARPEWAAAPLVVLELLPAFGGHAATQHPAALYVIANVVHVLAISVWFGGLVALLAVLPAAARASATAAGDAGVSSDRSAGLVAATLRRFSRVALAAVALILLTGTLQAIWELTALDDLVDTAFGRAILVKVVLLGIAGLFAARNHRSVPAIADGTPRAGELRGADAPVGARRVMVAVRAEVALVVAIFAASGALGGYPPPTQLPPGPFAATKPIGPYRIALTVDPAQAGSNQIRIVLTLDGKPATDTKQLTVTAVEVDRGIGPLSLAFAPVGDGTFVSRGALLPAAGHWRLQVVDRVSEFDEFQAFVTVPIR